MKHLLDPEPQLEPQPEPEQPTIVPEEVSQETSDTTKKQEPIFQDPEELVNAKRS
jgi:hypothetical protein